MIGAVRHQAITWTDFDPVLCHHMVSLGHNELSHRYVSCPHRLYSHIDGLKQESLNSSALAMELCLSCINPSILRFKKYRTVITQWNITQHWIQQSSDSQKTTHTLPSQGSWLMSIASNFKKYWQHHNGNHSAILNVTFTWKSAFAPSRSSSWCCSYMVVLSSSERIVKHSRPKKNMATSLREFPQHTLWLSSNSCLNWRRSLMWEKNPTYFIIKLNKTQYNSWYLKEHKQENMSALNYSSLNTRRPYQYNEDVVSRPSYL